MSHTPGPWTWSDVLGEVSPGDPDACELVAYGPEDNNGTMEILRIFGCEAIEGLSEANARLISAAPDLLEACHLICACFPCEPENAASGFADAYHSVRMAIKKADGR